MAAALPAAAAIAAALDARSELVARQPWRIFPDHFAEHASEGRWVAWDYLRYISQAIARAIVAGNGRIIVNMPPGHGKSELISHWLPTWFLEHRPHRRVILTSHSAELAAEWGRKVRNEFDANAYLTTRLSNDSTAADRWHTPEGGGMKTAGIGGGITGWRGDLILVDDPHPTWAAVNSEAHLKTAFEWCNGTLRDRAEPNATIVILMHRWVERDLTGQLIAHDPKEWNLIKLPALAEAGDILQRPAGRPLCPARYDAAALASFRRGIGSLVWFGKFQQRPAPPEGNYFKRDWFVIVSRERVRKMVRLVRVWDLAATAAAEAVDPDWLAGCLMGIDEAGDYWILDMFRDRLSAAGVESAIRQHAQIDGKNVPIRIEQEGAASGKLIKHHFTRMLDGWDCRFTGIPRGSKYARSGGFNAACERRQVKLAVAPWTRDFIDEAASFPTGAHDDQIDAAVGAYEALSGGSQEWGAQELQTVFGPSAEPAKMTAYEELMKRLLKPS